MYINIHKIVIETRSGNYYQYPLIQPLMIQPIRLIRPSPTLKATLSLTPHQIRPKILAYFWLN